MLQSLRTLIFPSQGSLARACSGLGWTGFWFQVVFGSLPILVMIYYFTFSRAEATARGGMRFIEYLTIANALLLVFTTFWSYRYTRLGKQIASEDKRPAKSYVVSAVWTGITAIIGGMLLSVVLMTVEAANLLFYFLKAPQAGMPVIQTSGTQAVHWVSSVDMLSLMALILTLFAELVVLVFSLWLLYRATHGCAEYPRN